MSGVPSRIVSSGHLPASPTRLARPHARSATQQALNNNLERRAKGVKRVEPTGRGGRTQPSGAPPAPVPPPREWSGFLREALCGGSPPGAAGVPGKRRVRDAGRAPWGSAGAGFSWSPGGERAGRGRRGRAGPWHGSPCRAGDRGGPGVEGRCFHQDASSLPRALPHPARPRSLPSVPPSGSSLPPALPPSRPPQPPPAGTCVSLVQFPLSLGCLSAGLRWLAPPPRAPPPPPPPAWPSPASTRLPSHSTPPPGVVLSGAPPSHLVFASRPPTCHWRRDVWESPAPRPPGPACPGAEVSHGRGAAGAGGQGGEEGGKEGGGRWPRRPRGPTGRRAQLPLLLSPAPRSRLHSPGPASEGRRRAGGAEDRRPGPWSGELDPGLTTEPSRPQVRRWRQFSEPSGTSESLPEGGIGDAGAAPGRRGWGPRKGWESGGVSRPALASPHRVFSGEPGLLIPGLKRNRFPVSGWGPVCALPEQPGVRDRADRDSRPPKLGARGREVGPHCGGAARLIWRPLGLLGPDALG